MSHTAPDHREATSAPRSVVCDWSVEDAEHIRDGLEEAAGGILERLRHCGGDYTPDDLERLRLRHEALRRAVEVLGQRLRGGSC